MYGYGYRNTFKRVGGAIFRPTQLAGTQLYYAKDTATPSLWNDQSPNGYDLSQATAIQQPTIGTDTVDFDGVNDVLFRNVADPFIADTQGVIFFSFIHNLGDASFLLSSSDDTTNNQGFSILSNTSNQVLIQKRIGGSNEAIILNSTNLVSGFNWGYFGSNGTSYFGNINGVMQIISAPIDNGDWFDSVTGIKNIAIGSIKRLTSGFSDTKLNKLYYNNTALSPTDMAKLETFFSDPNNY